MKNNTEEYFKRKGWNFVPVPDDIKQEMKKSSEAAAIRIKHNNDIYLSSIAHASEHLVY